MRVFFINKSIDLIILGSDGIFDRLNNKDVIDLFMNQDILSGANDPLSKLTKGVEFTIMEAMKRESFDNITVLAIAFENFIENCKINNL